MAICEELLVPRVDLLDALRAAAHTGDNLVELRLPIGILQDDETYDVLLLFRDQQACVPAIGRWTRGGAWVDLHALMRAVKPHHAQYVSMRRVGAGLYVDDQRVA